MPIVLGDARLTLADAPDGHYDVILVDAFASDTMPVHLMTKEAMAIYLRKLKPDGIVALHVSSRYMELVSVVAGIAQANGLVTRTNPPEEADESIYHYSIGGGRGRAHGEGFRHPGDATATGSRSSPIRANGCGPTTIPTSSAR